MNLYKISSVKPVAEYLAALLNEHLTAGERVLWLVPGGSALKVAAKASHKLTGGLSKLTVTLTDERWGKPGHPDSNWQQLVSSGFEAKGATMQPVLAGKDLEATARGYEQMIMEDFKKADWILCLSGIGTDNHTLGIKPNSPSVDSDRLVEGYGWEDYDRLTLTPKALRQVDLAVVYATGSAKKPAIDNLDQELPAAEQPAQALKLAKDLIIFTDFKGGELA